KPRRASGRLARPLVSESSYSLAPFAITRSRLAWWCCLYYEGAPDRVPVPARGRGAGASAAALAAAVGPAAVGSAWLASGLDTASPPGGAALALFGLHGEADAEAVP